MPSGPAIAPTRVDIHDAWFDVEMAPRASSAFLVRGVSASPPTRTDASVRIRPRAVLSLPLLVLGLLLLGLNVYGLGQSLRAPFVIAEPSDFSHDRIISADEAWSQLAALDPTDRVGFAMRASEIIGSTIKHLPYDYQAVAEDSLAGFYLTVPPWENYFLYLFRFLRPQTYRAFQFNGYARAIERGIGQCGQQSVAVAGFLESHGYNVGILNLYRHVVATAEVAPGTWYILDPDFGVSIPHSVEELEADPALVERYYADFNVRGTPAFRNPTAIYGTRPAEFGAGSQSRYPRGSVVEELAYLAKWPFPFVLILLGGLGLRRRTSATQRA